MLTVVQDHPRAARALCAQQWLLIAVSIRCLERWQLALQSPAAQALRAARMYVYPPFCSVQQREWIQCENKNKSYAWCFF